MSKRLHVLTLGCYHRAMKYYIDHDLSPELAKKAALAAADRYTEKFAKYDAKTTWIDDKHAKITFNVKGIHVGATMDLEPKRIGVDMEVPLLLRPFKSKAIAVVEDTVKKWIDKAHAGELD